MAIPNQNSLFERIGGVQGVKRLVGAFYRRVLADDTLAPFFEKTSMDKLEEMQIEFFSAALGGPLRYSGESLEEAHAGRGIGANHMQHFVGHLLAALEEFESSGADGSAITQRDKSDVIARINSYLPEITGQAPSSR